MSNRLTRRLLVDPEERALQRQLFLEEQCSLQTDLEDLIRTVEEEPFSVIAGELAAYVDNVVDDYSPAPDNFDQFFKDTLVRSIYDAIQFYKPVPSRKIGGPYFRHPMLLFHILLSAGCTDLQTFLTAFDHDIPEELLKIAQKRGDERTEEVFITEILRDVQSTRYTTLRDIGYRPQKARHIRDATSSQTTSLTKREGQLYYEYVGKIFAPVHPRLSRSNQLHCMRVKYADATANPMDLCSPEAALLRNDEITDDVIIAAFESEERSRVQRLTRKTAYLGRSEHHPDTAKEELKGSHWMKTLYKATTVRQAERLWSLHRKNVRDPVITAIPLSEVIVDTAQEVINHLCTYHCGGRPGQLTPALAYQVYKEHLDYKKRGGYNGITPVGEHPFDGLLSRFFDTSVRGDSSYIKSLDENRVMMLRAAFAFRELGQRFHSDSAFYLKGLSETGLRVAQPALV
ncbi:hypothetical protein HZC31_06290 [Candidatus Woesearchaeota archaeon]|nr:hypothetical protein [Candidatus Woesearchaeota archaeon]